jgi:hypothetical protein
VTIELPVTLGMKSYFHLGKSEFIDLDNCVLLYKMGVVHDVGNLGIIKIREPRGEKKNRRYQRKIRLAGCDRTRHIAFLTFVIRRTVRMMKGEEDVRIVVGIQDIPN